jgi:flagellin
MSFTLNAISTQGMSIQANIDSNNRGYMQSLERLSTGLRINSASDDSASMMIADSLRYKSKIAEQSIQNINDNIGIFRIADQAMGTQVNTLIEAKTKAVYLANDPVHSKESKESLEDEVRKYVEASDLVATNTYFNGKSLLDGYNGSVPSGLGQNYEISIQSTKSENIGHVSIKQTDEILNSGTTQLAFRVDDKEYYLHDVEINTTANSGVGRLAEVINQKSDTLGVKATYEVEIEGSSAIAEGTIKNLKLNGIDIGNIDVKANDKDGTLVNSINKFTVDSGVEASVDVEGKLVLKSLDGRGIKIENDASANSIHNLSKLETYGKLKMTSLSSDEILLRDKNNYLTNEIDNADDKVFTLKDALTIDDKDVDDINSDFTALYGSRAEVLMSSLESAIGQINKIRMESVASGETQLQHSIDYLASYAMTSKQSESMLRDADFAEESKNFSKYSILIQAGSFAAAQNNKTYNSILYNLV